jgi:cobalamin biosynthetic protein CobC
VSDLAIMRSPSGAADPFALPQHGGDLALAAARFGQPAEGWLDLSTGINPFAYPVPSLPPVLWQRLPDSGDDWALREVAAAAYGVDDPDWIAIAAGSQAVLQILPRLRPFSQVAVIGPTYGEYSRCWSNAGHHVMAMETLDRSVDADIVVLCHPNNPDGRRHDGGRLLELADRLAARGGFLLVDEAFVDPTPELSLAPHVRPGLVVLRSIGKFFGLAGLRLGFAIAEPQLARLLRQSLGPWPVSGAAIAIGAMALADREWIEATRRRLQQEITALNAILGRTGLSVVGGTALFTLANASRAWALYEYLGQKGILARPFADAPRWLRFGLPPGDAARQRLAQALEGWV